MGSKTFDGVRFSAYTDDHLPPHVHGSYAGVQVIIELRDGETAVLSRRDAITPPFGKRSDVNHILHVAAQHADKLVELWRVARG